MTFTEICAKFDSVIKEVELMEEELAYLRWWVATADFGPADGDVRDIMNTRYSKETGNEVPANWREE